MTTEATDPPIDMSVWTRVELLAGDASVRRYSRLSNASRETAILAEYPPSVRAQLPRDLEVLRWCSNRGLRVPKLYGSDPATGRVVLEDLGANDAEATLRSVTAPARRRELIERALAPLELLADVEPRLLPPWNPPLDRSRLRWELAGFELWFVRHLKGRTPTDRLQRWLDELAATIGGHPRRVCHRDYHLNNLLFQPDGSVGIVDIQDILVGPDTYDAVSLVSERAAVRLLPSETREETLASWAARTGAAPGWRRRAAAVRLQRGLKVAGSFARFVVEGRSASYSDWLAELTASLAEPLRAATAPPEAVALLLD
jgi:aminoglycoside/choline kinase family phosphotransferase